MLELSKLRPTIWRIVDGELFLEPKSERRRVSGWCGRWSVHLGCRDESVSFYNQKARVLWPTYRAAGIKIFNSPFSHDKSMVNVSGKVYTWPKYCSTSIRVILLKESSRRLQANQLTISRYIKLSTTRMYGIKGLVRNFSCTIRVFCGCMKSKSFKNQSITGFHEHDKSHPCQNKITLNRVENYAEKMLYNRIHIAYFTIHCCKITTKKKIIPTHEYFAGREKRANVEGGGQKRRTPIHFSFRFHSEIRANFLSPSLKEAFSSFLPAFE